MTMFEKISKISVAIMLVLFFCVDLMPQNLSNHVHDMVEMQENMKGEGEKENKSKESKNGREIDEYVSPSFLVHSSDPYNLYFNLAHLNRGYTVPVLEGPFLPPELG